MLLTSNPNSPFEYAKFQILQIPPPANSKSIGGAEGRPKIKPKVSVTIHCSLGPSLSDIKMSIGVVMPSPTHISISVNKSSDEITPPLSIVGIRVISILFEKS